MANDMRAKINYMRLKKQLAVVILYIKSDKLQILENVL